MRKTDPPARRVQRSSLASLWTQYTDSYDASVLDSYVHPKTVLPVVFGITAILLLMYFISAAQRYTEFHHPWIPISLVFTGCITSLLQWKFWKTHIQFVNVLQLLDTCIYCLAVVAVMIDTATPVQYVWGLIYAQMAASYGQRYSFNWPMFIAVSVIPFGVTLYFSVNVEGVGILALTLFGALMFIVTSSATGKARAVERRKERLESAYVLSDKVASDSLDIALATTMAEVGNFLHELRNASTPVIANLMLLREHVDLHPDIKEGVESLEKSNARTTALIEKLLANVKGRVEAQSTTFELSDALNPEMLGSGLAPVDRRAVTLEGEVPQFELNGSPEHLKAAIDNLLQNARNAGAKTMIVSASYDGGLKRAIIKVTDDGPGIPEDMQDDLFLPASKNHKGAGHGLGLPLSKRLVEVLGGTLRLLQTGPDGTTFEIAITGRHLPTSDPPSKRPSKPAP